MPSGYQGRQSEETVGKPSPADSGGTYACLFFFAPAHILGLPDGLDRRDLRRPAGRDPGGNQDGGKGGERCGEYCRPGNMKPHHHRAVGSYQIGKIPPGERKRHADSQNSRPDSKGNAHAAQNQGLPEHHPPKLPGRGAHRGQKPELPGTVADGDGKGAVHKRNPSCHDKQDQNRAKPVEHPHIGPILGISQEAHQLRIGNLFIPCQPFVRIRIGVRYAAGPVKAGIGGVRRRVLLHPRQAEDGRVAGAL